MDAISCFPLEASECVLNSIEEFVELKELNSVCTLWNAILGKNQKYRQAIVDNSKISKLLPNIDLLVVQAIGGAYELCKLTRIDLAFWKQIKDERNVAEKINEPIMLAINEKYDDYALIFKAFGMVSGNPTTAVSSFSKGSTFCCHQPINDRNASNSSRHLFQKNIDKTEKLIDLQKKIWWTNKNFELDNPVNTNLETI